MLRLARFLLGEGSLLMSTLALAGVDSPDLASARRLLLAGNYAEAAEIYGRTAAADSQAAIGLARALAAQGKLDEAAKALARPGTSDADLEAELARLALERGDYKTAADRVEAALRLQSDQLLARWIQAELQCVAGRRVDEARAYADRALEINPRL